MIQYLRRFDGFPPSNVTNSPHQSLDSDDYSVSRVDRLTSAYLLLASANDGEAWTVLEHILA